MPRMKRLFTHHKMRNQRNTKEYNLPDYANWQNGKTAASIKFARDVMILLQQDTVMLHEDRKILQDTLRMIKSGEISFSTWVTPQDWIDGYKNEK